MTRCLLPLLGLVVAAPLHAQAGGPDTKPLEVSSDLSFIKQTGTTLQTGLQITF